MFVPRHDGSRRRRRRRRRLPGHKFDPVADNIATHPNENNYPHGYATLYLHFAILV